MGSLGYSDLTGCGLNGQSERARTGVGIDEWGCRWAKTEMANMGQVVEHPLTDYARVADYPFPDPHEDVIFTNVQEAIALAATTPETASRAAIRARSAELMLPDAPVAPCGPVSPFRPCGPVAPVSPFRP